MRLCISGHDPTPKSSMRSVLADGAGTQEDPRDSENQGPAPQNTEQKNATEGPLLTLP